MTDVDWPQCRNARDLGGLPTMDGSLTSKGALYRTDGLFLLTEAGVAAVRTAGVTRIIDLRWQRELDSEPSPFAGDPVYCHVPMLDDPLPYEVPHDTYAPMLEFNRDRIAEAFAALATAPAGGGVIVHCHGGRDRTGVLVALALAVAGVPDEEIVADYGLSPERLPVAMANTLDHLDERYGGASAYLREIGVPAEQIEAVRARLRS
jgi:protein tyrosine/serine phosphatase